MAGKTGTAQKLDPETGRYSQKKFTAWFMGAVPAEDPQLAIVVALDEPTGAAHTGGAVAAPLFARVAAAQLAHQGIITKPEPLIAEQLPTLRVDQRVNGSKGQSKGRRQGRSKGQRRGHPDEESPVGSRKPQVLADARARTATAAKDLPQTHFPPAVSSAPPGRTKETAGGQTSSTASLITILVPDFRGSSLRSAKQMAAGESLDLRIRGSSRGRVIHQTPAPGTIVDERGRTIQLSFGQPRGEG